MTVEQRKASAKSNRMRKSKIKNVTVHRVPSEDYGAMMSSLAKIHASIISRRLDELDINPEIKLEIINRIIEKLKLA